MEPNQIIGDFDFLSEEEYQAVEELRQQVPELVGEKAVIGVEDGELACMTQYAGWKRS